MNKGALKYQIVDIRPSKCQVIIDGNLVSFSCFHFPVSFPIGVTPIRFKMLYRNIRTSTFDVYVSQ